MSAKEIAKSASAVYSGGTIGAVASGLTAWAIGASGLSDHFHITWNPSFTHIWSLRHLMLGAMWGFLFMTPLLKSRAPWERALVFSLFPAFFELLYLMPFVNHQGYFGFFLGGLTPLLIFVIHLVWSFSSAIWIQIVR